MQLKRSNNETRFVSTVPHQVTSVQYSSDERIKKDIVDVDTAELLDRLRQVNLREYGYTDAWRRVRGLELNDVRVRGVIAQELNEVFPEHVQILDQLDLKGVKLNDFHQVDKQGLVMDVIGALQTQAEHFSVNKPAKKQTRSVEISSAGIDAKSDEKESGAVTIKTGLANRGASGGVNVETGEAASSGDINISPGRAQDTGGAVKIRAAPSVHGSGGSVSHHGGSSELGAGGSLEAVAGSSRNAQGGSATFGSGHSDSKNGGEFTIKAGAGYLSGGSVSIKSGSSSNSAGAIGLVAGDASGGQEALGGPVRLLSGSGDVSGTVSIGSGVGGRESKSVWTCQRRLTISLMPQSNPFFLSRRERQPGHRRKRQGRKR